ncbi:MAG: hypothetical protein EOQ46_26070 [Mesorhizobium sp.]|uniref:hypothetical protein n=1 Tax=Mesorhizobium sp. TaxID=1871066 RepID=UPI000FE9A36B|nr:hypothetical protein [Mesorhizobium sp.]RWB39711.1 MAG: hypothetical protein EOQ46_26070 [Mesorhizobium sp.]
MNGLVDTVNPLRAKGAGAAGWNAFSRVPGITLTASRTQTRDKADPFSAEEFSGELDGHRFRLKVAFDDVIMEGRGWRIVVPEARSANPEVCVTDQQIKSNPILDEDFHVKALRVAQIRAEQVRARIASDWPRRSTVPDADGNVQHPFSAELPIVVLLPLRSGLLREAHGRESMALPRLQRYADRHPRSG